MLTTIDNLGDAKAAARDLDILRQAKRILDDWRFIDTANDLDHSINQLDAALTEYEEGNAWKQHYAAP